MVALLWIIVFLAHIPILEDLGVSLLCFRGFVVDFGIGALHHYRLAFHVGFGIQIDFLAILDVVDGMAGHLLPVAFKLDMLIYRCIDINQRFRVTPNYFIVLFYTLAISPAGEYMVLPNRVDPVSG